MISKLDNMVVRQMVRTDLEAVMQIKNAEKWNQTEQDWQFLMAHDPKNCLVACIDHNVIGTVTAINYNNQVGWIGMMLVSKEYRGLGVSKTLLNSIIEKLHGCQSIKLDATPAGIYVYEKIGFAKEYDICRMTIARLPQIQDHCHYSNITLQPTNKTSLSKVTQLDEEFFGANRSGLLQFFMEQKHSICVIAKQGRKIVGFVFNRAGSNYIQVGPVMAVSNQIARVLLRCVLKRLKAKPIVVDVLVDKIELINWLCSIGFTPQRKFTRMYLKTNNCTGMVEKQYLIGGPELG